VNGDPGNLNAYPANVRGDLLNLTAGLKAELLYAGQ
jgi:hypothetical protein